MAVITQTGTIKRASSLAGLPFVALLVAGTGALFGVGAFLVVAAGDVLIPFSNAALLSVALVGVGLVGVIIVRDLPGIAAALMAAVPVGLSVTLGDRLGPWSSAFAAAVQTRGPAELAAWASMPAMSLFVISGVLFACGAVVAAFSWNERM